MTKILLIDIDANRCQDMSDSLQQHGFTVAMHTVANLQAVEHQDYDCVIGFDEHLRDHIKSLSQHAPLIVLSEHPSVRRAVSAVQAGAADFMEWPVDMAELNVAIERASLTSQRTQMAALAQFPLIGQSEAMQFLKRGVAKAGPTQSPVLITGPSGVGKELLARAVHASSPRAGAALITINCATVPANLIETELFGVAQLDPESPHRSGLVAAANGGTLFLDEVAELPETAQAKLVQVLNGENRPVGSSSTEPVDIRIIAATHRSLDELVESETFRNDLYYRLNVVRLEMPPLRDREDDVLDIASFYLERTSARLGKTGLTFSADARQAMRDYDWPGNVREVENAIERAVILSDSNSEISQELLAIEPSPVAEVPDFATPGDLTSLEDYFVKFVQQHQDQLTETELAEKLGISRKSLWERRQRLNIPRKKTRKRGPRQDSSPSQTSNNT